MQIMRIKNVLMEINFPISSLPKLNKSDQLSKVIIVKIVMKLCENVEKC